MNFIRQVERYQKLNKLIYQQSTGTPSELAERLNLKRSQLYEVIDLLKIQGAPIKYSRKLRTFYYSNEYNLEISLKVNVLSGNEVKRIYGGKVKIFINKFILSDETGRDKFNLPMHTVTYGICR